MAGSQNGWGGARPNTGGKRAGAGRLQQRITVDLETARLLRELVRQWTADNRAARWTPDTLVEALIYREALQRAPLDSPERERMKAVARGDVTTD